MPTEPQTITSRWRLPIPCWVWCATAAGYDPNWWHATKRLDLFTIGGLTHWHPDQPEEPQCVPQNNVHEPQARQKTLNP